MSSSAAGSDPGVPRPQTAGTGYTAEVGTSTCNKKGPGIYDISLDIFIGRIHREKPLPPTMALFGHTLVARIQGSSEAIRPFISMSDFIVHEGSVNKHTGSFWITVFLTLNTEDDRLCILSGDLVFDLEDIGEPFRVEINLPLT